MERIKVLITAAGGTSALGIMKCLKDIENINIIGVDCQPQTAGNPFYDKMYVVPHISFSNDYKKAIKVIIELEDIDVVFPTLHDEINLYKEFRKELDALVALPQSRNFEVLNNKEKLYEYMSSLGMYEYIPKYYIFNENEELKRIRETEFADRQNVCVKDIEGSGGFGFAILTNRENFLEAIKTRRTKVYDIDDYYDMSLTGRRMVMEYLDGDEYSVDMFVHNGKVIAAVPRKRSRVSNCIVIDGTVEYNKSIIEASTKIAEAICDNGFINLQFIGCGHGFKLTDVNARFCGSQIMSFGAGVNFPYLFIQYNLLNEYVGVSPIWNTRMIRYWESCFFYN
jgi:carbamoyl-phosphate synthase large subunit